MIDPLTAGGPADAGYRAPAEMNFFFPASGALCIAENYPCLLHNLYAPRGAPTRDARGWARYIDEALALWGDATST